MGRLQLRNLIIDHFLLFFPLFPKCIRSRKSSHFGRIFYGSLLHDVAPFKNDCLLLILTMNHYFHLVIGGVDLLGLLSLLSTIAVGMALVFSTLEQQSLGLTFFYGCHHQCRYGDCLNFSGSTSETFDARNQKSVRNYYHFAFYVAFFVWNEHFSKIKLLVVNICPSL